ncbi:two component transcriptional regulator, LuxR family [Humidesulfovibrio mexicanus]|uniref:Two component transcriptional regulator, LuxR family n=1 Tax=Humidesulfovibrio mexicanus TaxID=147047 RepID=A0A239C1C5_9BACT|nr:response regulator transcription factor [Humidesulfovibrio mexicanus]SNS13966.1 two component transcriptional regulator, LuxR family [Humidesulfovibrio mexicanus]
MTNTTDTKRYKVLLAEDHALLRQSLKAYLEAQGLCQVIGEAQDGREAMRMCRELKPDIVLMDLSMPGVDGMVAVKAIKRDYPDARIIALTAHRSEDYLHAALDSGVDGYVVKAASAEDLLTAIRAVCRGEAYVSPEVSATLITGYLRSARPERTSPLEGLTTRERHILQMVLKGMKNKEIAEKLFLSTRTVEKHRANFMKKLDVHNLHQVREFVKISGLEVEAIR